MKIMWCKNDNSVFVRDNADFRVTIEVRNNYGKVLTYRVMNDHSDLIHYFRGYRISRLIIESEMFDEFVRSDLYYYMKFSLDAESEIIIHQQGDIIQRVISRHRPITFFSLKQLSFL